MNRLIKLIISLIIYIIEKIGFYICRLLKIKSRSRCVIIYYHNITKDNHHRFKSQIGIIKQFCKVIDIKKKIPINDRKQNYLVITFDDAFKNIFWYAIPDLIKFRYSFTIFVPTGYIGKHAGWINQKKEDHNLKIMNQNDLLHLAKNPQIIIGSHTVNHRNLSLINNNDAINELKESKITLEHLLGTKIKFLSFPYGEQNDSIIKLAQTVGYENVYSIVPKLKKIGRDEFMIGRIEVSPSDLDIEFKLKILGCYRWLPIAFKIKKILHS